MILTGIGIIITVVLLILEISGIMNLDSWWSPFKPLLLCFLIDIAFFVFIYIISYGKPKKKGSRKNDYPRK